MIRTAGILQRVQSLVVALLYERQRYLWLFCDLNAPAAIFFLTSAFSKLLLPNITFFHLFFYLFFYFLMQPYPSNVFSLLYMDFVFQKAKWRLLVVSSPCPWFFLFLSDLLHTVDQISVIIFLFLFTCLCFASAYETALFLDVISGHPGLLTSGNPTKFGFVSFLPQSLGDSPFFLSPWCVKHPPQYNDLFFLSSF